MEIAIAAMALVIIMLLLVIVGHLSNIDKRLENIRFYK
jgi:hypothetical protein